MNSIVILLRIFSLSRVHLAERQRACNAVLRYIQQSLDQIHAECHQDDPGLFILQAQPLTYLLEELLL